MNFPFYGIILISVFASAVCLIFSLFFLYYCWRHGKCCCSLGQTVKLFPITNELSSSSLGVLGDSSGGYGVREIVDVSSTNGGVTLQRYQRFYSNDAEQSSNNKHSSIIKAAFGGGGGTLSRNHRASDRIPIIVDDCENRCAAAAGTGVIGKSTSRHNRRHSSSAAVGIDRFVVVDSAAADSRVVAFEAIEMNDILERRCRSLPRTKFEMQQQQQDSPSTANQNRATTTTIHDPFTWDDNLSTTFNNNRQQQLHQNGNIFADIDRNNLKLGENRPPKNDSDSLKTAFSSAAADDDDDRNIGSGSGSSSSNSAIIVNMMRNRSNNNDKQQPRKHSCFLPNDSIALDLEWSQQMRERRRMTSYQPNSDLSDLLQSGTSEYKMTRDMAEAIAQAEVEANTVAFSDAMWSYDAVFGNNSAFHDVIIDNNNQEDRKEQNTNNSGVSLLYPPDLANRRGGLGIVPSDWHIIYNERTAV